LADPVAAIERSLTNGWNGIFDPHRSGKAQTTEQANDKFVRGVQDTMGAVKGVFND
jgi:hypothetical protein